MSYILGIDTSSTELSVGLVQDRKPFFSCTRYVRNSHAEHICSMIHFVLHSNNINAEQISRVGITVGPGSFTGLRIGIAFLKGFLIMRDTPVLPISSLECMCHALPIDNGRIVAAMDARKEHVFYALFRKENRHCTRLTPDVRVEQESFLSICEENDIIVTDTMGYVRSSVFNPLMNHPCVYTVETAPLQRGLANALIAAHTSENAETWKRAVAVVPEYLQPPYTAEKK